MRRKPEVPYPQCGRLWRSGVLVYMERDGRYLMLNRGGKLQNDVDEGRWTGVGGRKAYRENLIDVMLREVQSTAGVTLTKWRYRGLLEFYYDTKKEECHHYERIYLFTATDWEGEINADCPEGTLKWVQKGRLPRMNLRRRDRVFLKLIESDMKFFHLMLDYSPDGELMDAALNSKHTPKEPWDV